MYSASATLPSSSAVFVDAVANVIIHRQNIVLSGDIIAGCRARKLVVIKVNVALLSLLAEAGIAPAPVVVPKTVLYCANDPMR